jgi:hypothetical protein
MNQEFKSITAYLSRFSLDNLIVCSSLLSAIEFYRDWKDKFPVLFPMINQNNSAMFTRALIYSDSKYFKKRKIKRGDLPKIINTLNDASSREEYLNDDTLTGEEKFYLTISSLMSSQIWYQRHSAIEKTGLLYALYSELPKRHHTSLRERHKSNFVDIPKIIAEDLGIDLELYFLISLYLVNDHFRKIYDNHIAPSDDFTRTAKKLQNDERKLQQLKATYLGDIIEKGPLFYELLSFSKEWLKKKLNFIDSTKIDNYLKLTSISIKKLKELNDLEPFQNGHISQRLTPLERYPIVKADFPVYFIPNFRFANVAFTELLRFALQDLYKNNAFNEMLGSCQELLIYEMLVQLSSNLQIIKEREYKKHKTHYKGPDFTLLDRDRLIVIESKAKNVNLNSRLNHYSEYLLKDLDGVINALVKAENQKVKDIINDKATYGDINQNLSDLKQHPPILVGVIGEGVVTMQEHITKLKEKFPRHKINKIKQPNIYIDIYHLFKAIEICKSNGLSLYDILYEYWEIGNNLSGKSDSADMFGSRSYDDKNTYSQKMFEKLFDEGGKIIQ